MASPSRPAPGSPPGPHDDVARLRLAVLRLARQIRTNSSSEVTPSQVAAMATLARHGPCTINEIAELERIRAPSASKLVAGLEERGLAERRRDSEDRRRSVITLSREGERLLADMRAAGMSWLAARLDTLDGSDRRAVRDALPALERLLGTET